MKKMMLSVAAFAMTLGATLLISCSTEDTTGPVITLTGNENDVVTYKSNTTYTDPGATANDDVDGKITVVVTGTVDMNSAGDYVLTYTATDAAGNSSTKKRNVTVDAAPYLAKTWKHTDNIDGTAYPPENEAITVSATTKNKIYFSKFAGYTNAQPYALLSGSSMTMPAQTFMCGVKAQANRSFASTAAASFTSTGFTINYTITEDGVPVTASSVYEPTK